MPILIPGIGAQGGALEAAVKNGIVRSADGQATSPNVLINSARGIIYADRTSNGFADGARAAAARLRDDINRVLLQEGMHW